MKKQWTVLVYMAGDNNLDTYTMRDLTELAQVGSGETINILAQVDRRRQYIESKNSWSDTRRFYIFPEGTADPPWQPVGPHLGETNTGDPDTLYSFLVWALKNYPAERTMLVLWNHGGGLKEDDIYRGTPAAKQESLFDHKYILKQAPLQPDTVHSFDAIDRYILTDDTSSDFLDNMELEYALNLSRQPSNPQAAADQLTVLEAGFDRFDILGFDACMMNMFEVVYQIRNTAHIAVGSEEIEPPEGWPYTPILKTLSRNPNIETAEFAAEIVDHFIASYQGQGRSVTQSAVDTSQIEVIARAIDDLASVLIDEIESVLPTIRLILPETQRFKDRDYIDLLDFASLLTLNTTQKTVKSAAQTVRSTASQSVLAQGNIGEQVRNAHGISIFFPSARLSDAHRKTYANLEFSRRYPNWLRFLEACSSTSTIIRR